MTGGGERFVTDCVWGGGGGGTVTINAGCTYTIEFRCRCGTPRASVRNDRRVKKTAIPTASVGNHAAVRTSDPKKIRSSCRFGRSGLRDSVVGAVYKMQRVDHDTRS